MWADAKAAFKEMIEMIPIPKNTGWKKHSQVRFLYGVNAVVHCLCVSSRVRSSNPICTLQIVQFLERICLCAFLLDMLK
jgi:hypothetical protein